MDTLSAFARGEANRGNPLMVFDWDEAARRIKAAQPQSAAAGLQGDWGYTGGDIYRDGAPVPSEETYTYLASTWAVPELDLDGDIQPCWIAEPDTSWSAGTYWPDSAVAILRGEES